MSTTKLYLHNIDLSQNQLINPVLHNATSAPTTPADGQLYYNTTTKKVFYYRADTAEWKEVGGSIYGTENYLAKFATGNTLAQSLIYDNGSAIGIGTTSMTSGYLVNVAGRMIITSNSNSPIIQLQGDVSSVIEGLDITGNASGLLNGYIVNTSTGGSAGSGWRFGNNVGLRAQIFVGSGNYIYGPNRFFVDVLGDSTLELGSRGGNIDFNSGNVGATFSKMRMYNDGRFVIGSVATSEASALFNVNSTTKGAALPRMTQSQRTSIIPAAVGLLVYQTDGEEGLYENTSTGWRLINQATSTSPTSVERYSDIKIATENQTIFVSGYSFLGAVVDVFYNGSKLAGNEYTVTDNTTITLASPAAVDDVIEILVLKSAISTGAPTVNTITTNYTATILDSIILANTTTSDLAVTLPTAASGNQKGYTIKNIGSKSLYILPSSGQTIDGQTSWVISSSYSSLTIIPQNNNWYII